MGSDQHNTLIEKVKYEIWWYFLTLKVLSSGQNGFFIYDHNFCNHNLLHRSDPTPGSPSTDVTRLPLRTDQHPLAVLKSPAGYEVIHLAVIR